MRWFLLLLLSVVLYGCDPGITITIENETDQMICAQPSISWVGHDPCYHEVPPRSSSDWGDICARDMTSAIVLTVGVGDDVIYQRSATCGEWEDSGAKITVTKADGEFEVTDSLPDS